MRNRTAGSLPRSGQPTVNGSDVGRLLLVVGIVVLCGAAFILADRYYVGFFDYTADQNQSLTITATRGETFSLGVNLGSSINGYWTSASGLVLTLQQIPETIQIAAPQAQEWGATIGGQDLLSQGSAMTVSNDITLPSSLGGPEERVLTGTLSGDILYPMAVGELEFQDTTINVSIPVQIRLVSASNAPWLGAKALLYTTALLDMLLIACLPLLLRLYDSRTGSAAWYNPREGFYRKTRKKFLQELGARAALILFFFAMPLGFLVGWTLSQGGGWEPYALESYILASGLALVAVGTPLSVMLIKFRRAKGTRNKL